MTRGADHSDPRSWSRRAATRLMAAGALTLAGCPLVSSRPAMALIRGPAPEPVLIGFDADFGQRASTAARALEWGMRVALDEINVRGGVLGGRRLELVISDNRSMPARAIENFRELAAIPDLIGVFTGRFSPSVLACVPLTQDLGMPLFCAWAAADGITENGQAPNWAFRLSPRDGLALPVMLNHARTSDLKRVGLLLPVTAWGRSALAAAERHLAATGAPQLVGHSWYPFATESIVRNYGMLVAAGAEAVIVVANDRDGGQLLKEIITLPPSQRRPIIAHWGITGGNLLRRSGGALGEVDVSVVQSFSFQRTDSQTTERIVEVTGRLYGVNDCRDIPSPCGFAQAYDLMHIVARTLEANGSTDRRALRDGLELASPYRGLIKSYDPPFTSGRHDALEVGDLFMARYQADGSLVPLNRPA